MHQRTFQLECGSAQDSLGPKNTDAPREAAAPVFREEVGRPAIGTAHRASLFGDSRIVYAIDGAMLLASWVRRVPLSSVAVCDGKNW